MVDVFSERSGGYAPVLSENVVRRARLIQFNKLQREYRVYTAELRRRYS